jgi:hypothetical protein
MERRTRSSITTGTSVKKFSVAHPMESSGYQAAVAGLDGALREAGTLEDQQREGIITERRGVAVRRGVIDRVWEVHLPHLWAAARRAEREQPDLARTFRLKPTKSTIAARRAAAGSMLDAAQANKEVLVRYGMDDSVVNDLVLALAEFDAANEQCIAGRGAHVGATARLQVVGQEIVELVRVIDGLNRVRFRNDEALLAEWVSMSTRRAESKGGPAEETGPVAGSPLPASEVTRPAA